MKKFLVAILLGGILPFSLFAYLDEENFIPLTEIEKFQNAENFLTEENFSDEENFLENSEIFPSLSEMILTISEWRTEILSRIHNEIFLEKNPENPDSETLLTREFAVYLLLQEMNISFSRDDGKLFSDEEKFSDLDSDSFFTPYILFAKKAEILKGYDDGTFQPKNLITQEEFQNILNNAFEANSLKIFAKYNELKFSDEEKLLLFSAGNPEEKISLQEAHALVQNIIPFEHDKWYEGFEDEGKILLTQHEDGEIYFPKIENISEYNLYFEYAGTPFLSKKTTTLTLSEIREKILEDVNNYRLENNISPVEVNEKLENVAQNYAQQMFESKIFSHREVDGKNVGDRTLETGYDYMIALENIGKWPSADLVMQKWKESFTHNKNLLHSGVNEIGIGFYGNHWVQVFGKEFPQP